MTMTSTGPRPASSFSPSCSFTAVKMFGASGSGGGGGGVGRGGGGWGLRHHAGRQAEGSRVSTRLQRPLEREVVEGGQAGPVDHRPADALREEIGERPHLCALNADRT